MTILSIQSHVAFGHVGNAAAVFPLQRLGFEVWPVHTVQLSNHTGYETARGRVFGAEHVNEVIRGLGERDLFAGCEAVLTGYIGDAAMGEAVISTINQVRQANPNVIYCCDPVMGDVDTGLYVADANIHFFRDEALPIADIATPNQFETEILLGRKIRTLADARDAADRLIEHGPNTVFLTSLRREDGPADEIEMLAARRGEHWLISTPLLPIEPEPKGSGDVVAAFLLANTLRGKPLGETLAAAAAGVFSILKKTVELGRWEMALIAAQEDMVNPANRFTPVRLD